MSDIAIRVEGLGKVYPIRRQQRHRALRDVIAHAATAPWRQRNREHTPETTPREELLWAIRDVSFDVRQGEVLGVLGRNGAGKSTLLKILARIVEPTEGRAEIHGRVGSLLEVGTGFHSELTGRENIYLNGAILGMRKAEIDGKFDEIVAFAETERFLDTPVKHYSSGMYMRLAFAVAAHLETQVLLVDEVLAVGDAAFQQKCIGKIQNVAQSGRTIFFVSHQMDAIQRLCTRCLLFEQGQLTDAGPTGDMLARYLSSTSTRAHPEAWIDLTNVRRAGTGTARFVGVRYAAEAGVLDAQPYTHGPLAITLAIESDADRPVGSLAVTIYSQLGVRLLNADTLALQQLVHLQKGLNYLTVQLHQLHLNPGVYRLGLRLADPLAGRSTASAHDYIESAFDLEVLSVHGRHHSSDGIVPCSFSVSDVRAHPNG